MTTFQTRRVSFRVSIGQVYCSCSQTLNRAPRSRLLFPSFRGTVVIAALLQLSPIPFGVMPKRKLLEDAIAGLRKTVEEERKTTAELRKTVEGNSTKIRRLRKKAAREQGIFLLKELVGFIPQIHGTSTPIRHDPNYVPGKFMKLIGQVDFEADCQKFLIAARSLEVTSTSTVCDLFTIVTKQRNAGIHFSDPETCVKRLQNFIRKNEDMLVKCSTEVIYCVKNLDPILHCFIGPYRLDRLAAQCVVRVAAALGWKPSKKTGLIGFLKSCNYFENHKPEQLSKKDFINGVEKILTASAEKGPTWRMEKMEGSNYAEIQATFILCKQRNILPLRTPINGLQYFILENVWSPVTHAPAISAAN